VYVFEPWNCGSSNCCTTNWDTDITDMFAFFLSLCLIIWAKLNAFHKNFILLQHFRKNYSMNWKMW